MNVLNYIGPRTEHWDSAGNFPLLWKDCCFFLYCFFFSFLPFFFNFLIPVKSLHPFLLALRTFDEGLWVPLLEFSEGLLMWSPLPIQVLLRTPGFFYKAQFLFTKSVQAFPFGTSCGSETCGIRFSLAFSWESASWSYCPVTELLKVFLLQWKYKFEQCMSWISYDLYFSSQDTSKMLKAVLFCEVLSLAFSVFFCTPYKLHVLDWGLYT